MARRKKGKFLGRSIGAGRLGDSRDGDGDGFYSLKPGMPDKTPVPPSLELPSRASASVQKLIAESQERRELEDKQRRIARSKQILANTKSIEKKVTSKHGTLRNAKEIVEALKSAFPNSRGIDDFGGDQTNLDQQRALRFFAIGLLHVADQNPEAAKRLTDLNWIQLSDGAAGRIVIRPDDKLDYVPIALELHRDIRLFDDLPSLFKARQMSMHSWGFMRAVEMKEDKSASWDEIENFARINTAIHEMAHLVHLNAALSYREEKANKKMPDTGGSILDEQVLDIIDDVMVEVGHSRGMVKNQFEYWLKENDRDPADPKTYRDFTAFYGKQFYRNPSSFSLFMKAVGVRYFTDNAYDGFEPKQHEQIRNELSTASSYGMTNILEAVAETSAALEFGGEEALRELGASSYQYQDAGKGFMRWMQGKSVTLKRNKDVEKAIQENGSLCSGIYQIKKGKIVPAENKPLKLPKPDKNQMNSKALGSNIPRRPLQSLIRSARRDGDGDGLISIGPGAPDTTPAPRTPKAPAPSRLSSLARRNEDTLDLPPASGFGKKSGSIRELAKYFGFEAVHSGNYSYGKSPVARQIRKRLTPVSDSKIRGRGRPTPDYDVAEVEELIRSDKFLRSKIRRKKFDKEQVTVREIQDHFEFSDRAAVVTALRKAGVEPVGKQRASGSTGRGKPASVYNAEQVHAALEKRRNVWTPKEEKSYQMDHELHEKILGFGIGRRASRRFRRGAPKLPKDGDGDGKYSRGPGQPDDTPMPKLQVVSLPDEEIADIATSTGNSRSAKVAVKTAKKIEQDVLKKHGDIRKRKVAIKAVVKAFPNLTKNDFASPSRDLNDFEFNSLVGLLHMSGVKPLTAKSITELSISDEEFTKGGYMQPLYNETSGRYQGIKISLNKNANARANSGIGPHANSPWSWEMLPAMRRSGYSFEDQDKVFHQSIAMHEYGHAIHYDHGVRSYGMKIGDIAPVERWKYGFVRGFESTGISKSELEDTFDTALRVSRANNPNADDRTAHLDAMHLAFERTMRMMLERRLSQGDIPSERETRAMIKLFDDFVKKEATAYIAWDGVPEEKRDLIRSELKGVSGYANITYAVNPGGQYLEGVAEAISVREMTSGLSARVELQPAGRRHIRDLLTKADSKESSKKPMSSSTIRQMIEDLRPVPEADKMCRGLNGLPEKEIEIPKVPKDFSLKPVIESLKQEAESLEKGKDEK